MVDALCVIIRKELSKVEFVQFGIDMPSKKIIVVNELVFINLRRVRIESRFVDGFSLDSQWVSETLTPPHASLPVDLLRTNAFRRSALRQR